MFDGGIVMSRGPCDLFGGSVAKVMKKISYSGYRFPFNARERFPASKSLSGNIMWDCTPQ
jgi:hypothetical protein